MPKPLNQWVWCWCVMCIHFSLMYFLFLSAFGYIFFSTKWLIPQSGGCTQKGHNWNGSTSIEKFHANKKIITTTEAKQNKDPIEMCSQFNPLAGCWVLCFFSSLVHLFHSTVLSHNRICRNDQHLTHSVKISHISNSYEWNKNIQMHTHFPFFSPISMAQSGYSINTLNWNMRKNSQCENNTRTFSMPKD